MVELQEELLKLKQEKSENSGGGQSNMMPIRDRVRLAIIETASSLAIPTKVQTTGHSPVVGRTSVGMFVEQSLPVRLQMFSSLSL